MSTRSKLRADFIGAVEGAFWLLVTWSSFWLGFQQQPLWCLIPITLGSIAVAATFLHRPWALALSRYRVRLSRVEMLWHVLVIPSLLAMPLWMILERLFGAITPEYQLSLVAVLSLSGWCVYVLTQLVKRSFQSLRLNRKPAA
ncbi:hypothetical protein [Cobetia sp. L2A1]|uniref:hypothetical protein n=1 Tax=Cobetia sp. L2A1 TaxID=2686360 RepID=UPI00131C51C7|nr:hypothetical protein [Cobetia sp. L2A1]